MTDLSHELVNRPNDTVLALQTEITQLPQVKLATAHLFCDGMYARTILIPKGVSLAGAQHRRAHIFIIVSGEISIMTNKAWAKFKAPWILESLPGTKRIGYAHEDTIVTTVHRTNASTVAEAEKELCVPEEAV